MEDNDYTNNNTHPRYVDTQRLVLIGDRIRSLERPTQKGVIARILGEGEQQKVVWVRWDHDYETWSRIEGGFLHFAFVDEPKMRKEAVDQALADPPS